MKGQKLNENADILYIRVHDHDWNLLNQSDRAEGLKRSFALRIFKTGRKGEGKTKL